MHSAIFFGNWLWWHACALAHNVTRWIRDHVLPREFRRCRGKRLRLAFFNVAARVVTHARQLWLRIPRSHAWADAHPGPARVRLTGQAPPPDQPGQPAPPPPPPPPQRARTHPVRAPNAPQPPSEPEPTPSTPITTPAAIAGSETPQDRSRHGPVPHTRPSRVVGETCAAHSPFSPANAPVR
ncbi:MAG: transposase [Nocardioides sp.]